MPLESYELCPSCSHKIVLTKSSTGSFRCPDCQCEFRHNFRKWVIGIPVGLVAALLLLWLTYGSFIPPIVVVFLSVGVTGFILSRIPSYFITPPGSVPAEQPKS
jgi:uncharacterized membrane protein